VVSEIVTVCAEVYEPPAGENVGVAVTDVPVSNTAVPLRVMEAAEAFNAFVSTVDVALTAPAAVPRAGVNVADNWQVVPVGTAVEFAHPSVVAAAKVN
jgi:hypothetical protein